MLKRKPEMLAKTCNHHPTADLTSEVWYLLSMEATSKRDTGKAWTLYSNKNPKCLLKSVITPLNCRTVVVAAFFSWTLWGSPGMCIQPVHVQVQVHCIEWGLRARPLSITLPCRQQHSVFGGIIGLWTTTLPEGHQQEAHAHQERSVQETLARQACQRQPPQPSGVELWRVAHVV